MRQIVPNSTVGAAVYAAATGAADYLLQVVRHRVGICRSSLGLFAKAERDDVHGRVDHQKLDTGMHQVGYWRRSRPGPPEVLQPVDEEVGPITHDEQCKFMPGGEFDMTRTALIAGGVSDLRCLAFSVTSKNSETPTDAEGIEHHVSDATLKAFAHFLQSSGYGRASRKALKSNPTGSAKVPP
jgi:hypothetical protein